MSQDVVYSCGSEQSANHFTDILDLYLASSNQTMPQLDNLLEQDPDMTMAHLFRAYLLKLASDPRFLQPANASLTNAAQLPANSREAMHIQAAETWFAGNTVQANNIFEDILEQYPTDVLAARLAHHLHFYSGDAAAMRDSIAKVAKHFAPGDRHYSYVLGMHSFGCEEAGDYEQAEALGRQAVTLDSNDQWAVHAVAHVMQMQNRFDEGVSWLQQRAEQWQNSNNFVYHIHWHEALFELGRDNPEQALAIYDERLIAPIQDDFYLDVCNAASLLWRLEMLGIDVGDRWQPLKPYGRRTADSELVFPTLHYLLAPARLGDQQAMNDALSQLKQWQQDGSSQGQVVAEVGAPLAEAICAISEKNYQSAAQQLAELQPKLFKIGGSHAQRALFTDMQTWAEQQAA
jgi:tetratricopeptide (TPR) repeat protein